MSSIGEIIEETHSQPTLSLRDIIISSSKPHLLVIFILGEMESVNSH